MYLYGAGGHAKVIMDILKENSTELTGIIDAVSYTHLTLPTSQQV